MKTEFVVSIQKLRCECWSFAGASIADPAVPDDFVRHNVSDGPFETKRPIYDHFSFESAEQSNESHEVDEAEAALSEGLRLLEHRFQELCVDQDR